MSFGFRMLGQALASLLRRPRLREPGSGASAPAWLPARSAYEAARKEIGPAWASYVRTVSHPAHAISLELASFLLALARTVRPLRLLDLGSGFSSFVFRSYAREAGEPCEVVSVDDDAAWLERTHAFLRQSGLENGPLLQWEEFTASRQPAFDLVLHDLGKMERRFEALPQLARLRSDRGLIVFDDVHKPGYLDAVLAQCAQAGLKPYTLTTWTLDGYGRYAALAERP